MSWYVSFFGLNRPPAMGALDTIPWLTDWRLFHEPGTDAWFLEGQSATDAITFQAEVKTAKRFLTGDQKALMETIRDRIAEHDGFKQLFDQYGAEIAMLLSQDLKQPVAAFSAYDEGGESCFVFDSGKLVRGRLEIDWNKALAFDADGKAELEWLYPEGVSDNDSDNDPDFVGRRTMFQIGIEEASTFFGRHTLEDALSFDHEPEPGQFVLKAQKGAPDAPIRRPIDELNDVLGRSPTLQHMLDAFAPVVDAVLDEGFAGASNAHRFELDDQTTACSVYVSRLRQQSSEYSDMTGTLHTFLLELSDYTRRLRPAPEFRKSSIDFQRWRQKLAAGWRRLTRPPVPWFRKLFR